MWGGSTRLVAGRGLAWACACAAGAMALAGCGGARQDASEPKGSFPMKLVGAHFPVKQAVARPATLTIVVRNTGEHTVPNVAVTVDSFTYKISNAEAADPHRPVWAIEHGPGAVAKPPVQSLEVSSPGGASTAYVNTWALGPLKAGASQTFRWQVTPVRPGTYTMHYAVAAGLAGKAHAGLSPGGALAGHFHVTIAGEPPITHVNPNTGKLATGTYPPSTR